MSKIGAYRPPDKYKNYALPTSKPLRSHALYKEKVWTLQERIYKKLKKVAEFLDSLYPKLTDDFSENIKVVIEKNLEILLEDLDLMQQGLHKNPDSFNTNKLKINQHRITEMKNVCDTLQTVRSYEFESKKLSQVKHALHELEHLIQPTSFEISAEKARVKSKPKTQKTISKKTKQAAKVSKPLKVVSKQKKTTQAAKVPKPLKVVSKLKKTKAPASKLKQAEKKAVKPQSKAPARKPKLAEKKAIKPQSKAPAKSKNTLKAKPKAKIKTLAEKKTKLLTKQKKALSAKSKPKTQVKKVSKHILK
jgi:hypothetical protein